MKRSSADYQKPAAKKHRLKYKKVLLKISGELLGSSGHLFDLGSVSYIADQIRTCHACGARIAIVIGGGNILRGRETKWLNKVDADTCGMTATVINGLILQSALTAIGLESRLSSGLNIEGIAGRFNRKQDRDYFSRGGILVCVAGTGNPLFTTDTAAALRSIELEAGILIKATKVDGVFSADPVKNKKAILYRKLTFQEAIKKKLGIMDMAAFNICCENGMPVYVYNLMKFPLLTVLAGEQIGTLVTNGGKTNDQ